MSLNLPQVWGANRKFALKIFIVVFIVWEIFVIISSFLLPKSYVSTADIQVEILGTDLARDWVQSEAQNVLSPAVLSIVIDRLDLNKKWGHRYFNDEPLKLAEILQILKARLWVAPLKNSSVISIRSFSDSPGEAAEIANALAETYKVYREGSQGASPAGNPNETAAQTVSVQILNQAQPALRPCKPNIPLCIGIGIIVSTVYGALAAALAVGVRILIKKWGVKMGPSLKDNDPSMRPIIPKY